MPGLADRLHDGLVIASRSGPSVVGTIRPDAPVIPCPSCARPMESSEDRKLYACRACEAKPILAMTRPLDRMYQRAPVVSAAKGAKL